MGKLFQIRYSAQAEGEAGMVLKGPYAPLTEDDVGIAPGEDVLCGQEELLQGGRHPPLEYDRLGLFPHCLQEDKIAHVPGTYLEHIGILGYHLDMFWTQDLRNHGESCLFPRLRQIL